MQVSICATLRRFIVFNSARSFSNAPELTSKNSLIPIDYKLLTQNRESDISFSTLLRFSPFVQLGNFENNVIPGVVFHMTKADLYIDYGGKFMGICDIPKNSKFTIGQKVKINLKNFELSRAFLLNTKAITLKESDISIVTSNTDIGEKTINENLDSFRDNVLKKSETLPAETPHIKGFDFNVQPFSFETFFDSFQTMGFQAAELANAEKILNRIIVERQSMNKTEEKRFKTFLAYTSNMVSSGVREIIRYLVQNKLVDVLVTSAGGVEEDFVKCLSPFYVGDFSKIPGSSLRDKGINRIGNIYVPNDDYIKFEEWIQPLLSEMAEEQKDVNWTPSKLIDRLGQRINNPDSIYYWAHKNNIPVFCPGITDGSLGDMMFSHSCMCDNKSKTPLRVDVVEDIKIINKLAISSEKTAMIVLGGGIAKHHTFNANLMRNGSDFTVLINTAQEYDGSDSGARLDESISWGKVSKMSQSIKVFGDATILFPILVARTFFKHFVKISNENK